MTYEVQQTRWDQLIRRSGGSIGPGSRVSESISELFPVLDVESVPAELLRLGQVDICSGAAQATGAAAELPRVQVFNPADSGKLITVSTVYAAVNAANIIRFAFTATPLTNSVLTQRFRDLRHPTTELPVGQVRTESSGTQLSETGEARGLANETVTFSDQNAVAVLSPGTGLTFSCVSVTLSITVSFFWRERVALESELQF